MKTNANQRYASTSVTRTMVLRVAKAADVPVQEYETRNDMPCGSTIGPLISVMGLRTVDLGCAQLSMHSIREMGGVDDVGYMIKLGDAFFRNYERFDSMHAEADYDSAHL